MDRKAWELEAKLLYATLVAGKTASFADVAVRRFLGLVGASESTPFEAIARLVRHGGLLAILRSAKTGNYRRLARCWRELTERRFDLSRVGPQELERVHGIGPKTARFFITWTRPKAGYAVLDVHILRWLREERGIPTPRQTPQSAKKYAELERRFLEIAKAQGKTPKQLDAEIWDRYHRRSKSAGG
jgi:hypothetical protein